MKKTFLFLLNIVFFIFIIMIISVVTNFITPSSQTIKSTFVYAEDYCNHGNHNSLNREIKINGNILPTLIDITMPVSPNLTINEKSGVTPNIKIKNQGFSPINVSINSIVIHVQEMTDFNLKNVSSNKIHHTILNDEVALRLYYSDNSFKIININDPEIGIISGKEKINLELFASASLYPRKTIEAKFFLILDFELQ